MRGEDAVSIPPRNGEGDRAAKPGGGGGPRSRLNAPIKTVKRARKLRREMSLPEILLWNILRTRPDGFKFRRQHPVHPYNVDLACLEASLAIEVDGEIHERGNQPQSDERRDAWIEQQGYMVFRIPARDVLRDLDSVVTAIVALCRGRVPSPTGQVAGGPPPRSGEE